MGMKTNEEAKQEAIRKAYIKLFIESGNTESEANKRYSEIKVWVDSFGWFSGELYKVDLKNLDLSGHECRPITLRSLDDNNGWTRIEPDGSNLPYAGLWLKCAVLCEDSHRIYRELFLDTNKDGVQIWLTLDEGELESNLLVTHYKPIIEDKPPIY